MDVLQLIDAFDPERFGGAARVFRETSKILVADGHGVRAVCRMPDGAAEPAEIADFRSYRDVRGCPCRKLAHYRRSVRRLVSEAVAEKRPDLVIIHSSSAAMGALGILRSIASPVIYYFHSPWSKEHESKFGLRRMNPFNPSRPIVKLGALVRKAHEYEYLRSADGVVTLSEHMAGEMLVVHGDSLARIRRRVVPGGVDMDVYRPPRSPEEKRDIRARLALPFEAFVVISSRRMIPRTGLDVLIRAFASLDRSSREPRLVLTGDGPSKRELASLARELRVEDRVVFTGHVSEPDLADYYRAADLFVMPTVELEGFGLSTVEAMASGLPVVGTDIGGTPEIISRISRKLLIPEPVPEAISAKIAEFMAMDDLSAWGERSLAAVAERHTWRIHVDSLLDFARSLDHPA